MIYTDMTKRALKLCFETHRDQRDKNGMPYVFHPFHLAEQMTDEATTAIALLHDVVEDSPATLDDLRIMGFDEAVVEAVGLLTHDPTEAYMDYVARIRSNPLAMAVKRADLMHNMDTSRLDPGEAELPAVQRRLEKYRAALALLDSGESE